MNRISARLLLACSTVAVCSLVQPLAQADVLLMQRVEQERASSVPSRGMNMTQVESRFGAPTSKLAPAGGDAPKHPTINRWEYENFIVYFERDRVIDSVMKRASSNELGPKKTH